MLVLTLQFRITTVCGRFGPISALFVLLKNWSALPLIRSDTAANKHNFNQFTDMMRAR